MSGSGARQRRGGRQDEEEEEESESSHSRSTPQGSSATGATSYGGGKSSVGPPPSYDGSRSAGAWDEYRIRARLWLRTTPIEERARGPRMLQALTGQAFESMKHLADSDEWMEDPRNGHLLLEEMAKPTFFGKEELESLWGALQKLLYTKLRSDDDDLGSFRNKFEEAVRKIKKHGVSLPDQALGFLYLKQLRADSFTLERIITMTNGELGLEEVMTAARKLKMRLLDDTEDKRKQVWLQDLGEDPADSNPEGDGADEELEALEGALQDLEDETDPLNEDEAKDVLMNLIKQKVTGPVQNMSYRQVQSVKRDIQNARGFRSVQPGQNHRNRPDRPKADIGYLKSITRCKNCNMVGHWHRECPHKKVGSTDNPSPPHNQKQGWWTLCDTIQEEMQHAPGE